MKMDVAIVEKLYKKGLSQKAISLKLGCSQWKISDTMRKANLTTRNRTLKMLEQKEFLRKKINDDFFDKINEKSAWLLGFILSDGSIRGNRITIRLSLKDKCVLEMIKRMLDFAGKIRAEINKIKDKRYMGTVLEFTSKKIVEKLKKLGISENKTLREKIPPCMFTENEYLQRAFIRGIFDGDGSVVEYKNDKHKNQMVFQVVGTKELLNGLQQILVSNGVCGYKNIAKNGKSKVNHFCLRYVGNIQADNILKWLYRDAKVFMKRKHDKYIKMRRRLCL